MQNYEEIKPDQIVQHAPKLLSALEAMCLSPPFRSSPKGCEFLRHIVHHTIKGNVDELKERLIGMALLGRDASYDTSSDAGVRVRANDVRKRLSAYSSLEDKETNIVVELPIGTYVPRFFQAATEEVASVEPPVAPAVRLDMALPLSMHRLAAPTLVVLFFCAMCLRWQVAQDQPFQTFWQSVFQDHRVTIYLWPVLQQNGQELLSPRELGTSFPLFNLASQFHSQVALADHPPDTPSPHDVIVVIGLPPNEHPEMPSLSPGALDSSLRIEDTPGGRQIFGQAKYGSSASHYESAALLTLTSAPQRSIRIDGTDRTAIQTLVDQLSERDSFPEGIPDSVQDNSLTQIVFPMSSPHSQHRVFHAELPKSWSGWIE